MLKVYNRHEFPITAVCDLSSEHKVVDCLQSGVLHYQHEKRASLSTCKELGLIKFVKTVKEETTNQFSTQIHANT